MEILISLKCIQYSTPEMHISLSFHLFVYLYIYLLQITSSVLKQISFIGHPHCEIETYTYVNRNCLLFKQNWYELHFHRTHRGFSGCILKN